MEHPHHSTHRSLTVVAVAVLLTAAFHFLLAERAYGFGFAAFAVLLAIGIQVVAAMTGRGGNMWAYLFLLPAGFGVGAELLYASPVVRFFGFVLVIISLAFFAYWLTARRVAFWDTPSLWPFTFVSETILPFRGMSGLFRGWFVGKTGLHVLMGVLVALPFLFIFALLFASADAVFAQAFQRFFATKRIPEYIDKTIRDIIVLLFFLGSGWTILQRGKEAASPATKKENGGVERTIAMTFLTLVNVLFFVFLGLQTASFFGGNAFVQQYGIVYADYAREGFFQLLFAAGLVFLITWVLYRVTELRQWGTRHLSLLLIAQTGGVLLSAARRLHLYIDVYGLTVSRWWGIAALCLIALVLASIFLFALVRTTYHTAAKAVFGSILGVFATLLLVNVEGVVVKYNADEFLSGKTKRLDVSYMANRLSSDAVPALVALANASWPTEVPEGTEEFFVPSAQENYKGTARQYLVATLRARLGTDGYASSKLISWATDDWRELVISDYRAIAAIRSLDK
jgi:hypothetical protein